MTMRILSLFLTLTLSTSWAVSQEFGPAAGVIDTDADGLSIQITTHAGNVIQLEDLATYAYTTPEFVITDRLGVGIVTQEFTDGQDAYTIVHAGATCVILGRPRTEPAPTLRTRTIPGGSELTMIPAKKKCGGCMVAWKSLGNNETYECRPGCDTCVCQLCWTDPCPPPETSDPCEDWDDKSFESYEQCEAWYWGDEWDVIDKMEAQAKPR